MLFRDRRVQCLHCLGMYDSGDCVTFTCHDCASVGHRGLSIDCPVCSREFAERRARIDVAIAASKAGR